MKMQEWSIGIYTGVSPWSWEPAPHANNPVLTRHEVTDIAASFVADPFMLRVEQTWMMFFEVMNRHTGRGEIGLATSPNGWQWNYQQIVLRESFHLSYPYVFEWQESYYMVPESCNAGEVRLYKAEPFPYHWSFISTLWYGDYCVDPSIFRFNKRWWCFTETSPTYAHDTLRLYSANTLTGTWLEHPASPVREHEPQIARPAGRVVVVDGRPIRYTQDCETVYGAAVRGFEITDLSAIHYRERAAASIPILSGSGNGWNAAGMHHIDAHQLDHRHWIACVDGFPNP